ncbi:SMP-30/gluconolactonase/LRE family protein [Aestuariicoccus sp. MJ-SS9]|uniref:SMP-30/gluconolactonase/LRE family protein n=1 Tax=Aestuariicoccus sp. MJ-SS9 TaxID=3079855 RepID=UPI002915C206|nr:SMP-30/gluconolactonase/LRE family protein [Aestuariicoccus sp. MJ-SS9]MDU8913493.1 SMP-30/gluconolactonase/LRE family protein [Aestuariicoccus sp. MJ-SS9]
MSKITVESILDTRSLLGEGAVWDSAAQVLWWVDITAGRIHRYDPASGENRSAEFGEPVGCLAPRRNGGLVVAAKSGFWTFDFDTGARTAIADPEPHLPGNRFNDGTTDPAGRFWAGTMKDGGAPERSGAFYRLDPDMRVTCWKDGFWTTNGLAFAPDGKTMYFSDSNPAVRTIWAADYDAETGTPHAPRVFFDTNAVAGRPDGGTVDAEGCYWMAGVSGGQVYRITPEGKLDMTIDVPVEKPTKPMFGGSDLRTLYLTSIGEGYDDGLSGNLFAITGHGCQGIAQWRFAG